jgi:hypothetical protein
MTASLPYYASQWSYTCQIDSCHNIEINSLFTETDLLNLFSHHYNISISQSSLALAEYQKQYIYTKYVCIRKDD